MNNLLVAILCFLNAFTKLMKHGYISISIMCIDAKLQTFFMSDKEILNPKFYSINKIKEIIPCKHFNK